jgi:long-chain acyl-CoA synthetase
MEGAMARMEHNLAVLGEHSFERHGDYESLFFDGRWHRSGELFERARRLSAGLQEIGVKAGDRVVVMMANCPEVPIAYNAVWRAGAAITPAIFLLSRDELAHIVRDAEARVVVTTPEFVSTVAAAGGDATIVSTEPTDPGVLSFQALERADPAPIVPRADTDLAALMYTGGTTGRAKGVMLSHENLWLAGRSGNDAGHVEGVTRGLTALPLSHAFGLLVTAVGLHAREPPTSVLMRWFQAPSWLALAQEHQVQIAAVVPSMLRLLLAEPIEEHDLSALRYVASGGAPLPPETEKEFRRRVPGVEIREGYGLTETSALVSTNPPGRARPGSVGLPVPGTEVRIVDADDHVMPQGEVGEICCRSQCVMLGYWHAPELTADAMRGGWLHTGDMGYLDADGYLYVVDRKKDLIIRGGFNVFPRDVEEALLEHPAVAEAAVVGRPDEVLGEEVVAFVSLQPGAELKAEELVAYAKERIGGYKYPREIHVRGSLPLTPVGKVNRKALREQVQVREGEAWQPS